jgi:hypothetical protein
MDSNTGQPRKIGFPHRLTYVKYRDKMPQSISEEFLQFFRNSPKIFARNARAFSYGDW